MKPEKTKNGKWKYREKFKNPLTGKWQSVTVTYEKNNRHIEKIARKELDKRIEEKLSKIMNTKGDITLQRLTELYLADVKGILKEDSTYIMRTYSMKKIASVLGKDVLVSKLNPVYLNENLPNEYLRVRAKILLNWAYKNEFIEKKLADFIKLKPKKKRTVNDLINNTDEKQYYTREELKNIFDTLSSSELYHEKMARLVFETQTILGKRFGEVVALFEDDVDEENQIVHVYKRVLRNSINTPKTEKSISDLGVNSRMIQIKKEAMFLKRVYRVESEFLFAGKKGEAFRHLTARDALRRNGFNSKTHIFRKTCASLLAEQGVPLEYIQNRLGHENDKITKQIYIQITDKMKKEEQDFFKNIDIL